MSQSTTMAYIKDIAARINDPGIYGGASLMVGAGFSKNAECVGSRKTPPDWKELAESMYDELYPKPRELDKINEWNQQKMIKTSGKNTLHLAEEYIAFFDRNKMNTLIENNIADDMFKPGELHKRLLKLNWKDIFTTNYDTLLERTRDEIFPKRDYKIILSQDNLAGSGSGKARIIKLHGSISGVRPYIISEEDFRCYPIESAAFVNTVQQALIETTLCMVGFSGDDPNFLSWHGWLHDNLGENCPQVYLIGLFGKINGSEREIFRKRKIALVDLEELLNGNERNKYVEAYEKFFDLIEQELKEEDFSKQAPYFQRDIFEWKEYEQDEYVAKIFEFTNNILTKNGDMILLPQPERNTYRQYFSEQFKILLTKCKHINTIYIQSLSNLIAIRRSCLIPLNDSQADKLIAICNELKEKQINVSADWKIQMFLYMLEMFRIDSEEEKYQMIVKMCEENMNELSDNSKNMYRIELSKHAAGMFDAEEVKNQLEKIGKANLKIRIKKAGLYIQIGENDIAEKILEECLKDLGKLRLNSSLNASYKSYLSLCHAMLNRWWSGNDDYSDYEYRNDRYRTRTIIMEIENGLRDEILKEAAKDDTRANVFEVNITRGETLIIGENKLQRLSFEFILMLDMLCLPLFSDQSLLLPTAMYRIMDTSLNSYWKISFMVRSNNKDVIERIFSRRNIAKIDISVISQLYQNIWNCIEKTKYINFEYLHTFFSHINALNIISRIVVFLNDEKVIQIVKYIAKIQCYNDEHMVTTIRNFISRISTRFNGKIGENLLEEIFVIADSRFYLASYFTSFNMTIRDPDKYYVNAISLAGKQSDSDRDNGIAQILCLWRNYKSSKYRDQIEEVIWNRKRNMFPLTSIFYVMIWEELPHPDNINFSELYKEYIYNGLINDELDSDLFTYINLFYLTSPMSNGKYSLIEIDNKFLQDILKAIENKLKNKKDCDIGLSFWGKNIEPHNLRYINELLVMLYAIGIKDSEENNILLLLDSISEMLKQKKINGFSLEAVKKAEVGEYIQALDILRSAVWSNDENVMSEASIGYQAILFVAKKNNENISEIKGAIAEVMETLQYSDIKVVKRMWNMLCQLIVRAFSEDMFATQIKLAKIFENCIRSYSYRGIQGDKYYFEALYNCNKTLKCYYDEIVSKNIDIHTSLNNVVEYVKSLNIPELSSVWE